MYRHRPDPMAFSTALRAIVVVAAMLSWIAPLLLVRLRRSVSAVLLYWVLVSMLPPMALSFLTPVTDRYLFLPSVGICLLLAECLLWLGSRWRAMLLVAIGVVALVAGYAIFRRYENAFVFYL